jgi:predicted alpha/beta superfamily hydrolase
MRFPDAVVCCRKRCPLVDPHRTVFAGHSFGGLFTLHLLLNAPGSFDDYTAIPECLSRGLQFVLPTPQAAADH